MIDTILALIYSQIKLMMYLLIPVIMIVFLVLLLTMYKFKKRTTLYKIYPFLCVFIFVVIFSLVPRMVLTVNLFKDYNMQTVALKEGIVTQRSIKRKMVFIEIGKERFILADDIIIPQEGEKCEFSYLINSKLVLDLSIDK